MLQEKSVPCYLLYQEINFVTFIFFIFLPPCAYSKVNETLTLIPGFRVTLIKLIQVAAISGDARRALEICRRAAEITDYRMKTLMSNSDNVSEGAQILKYDLIIHVSSQIGTWKKQN